MIKNQIKSQLFGELIKLLCLNGCIVTIDAMGCQKEIVKLIVEQRGDYVITLKKNQSSLYKRVEELFQEAVLSRYQGFTHSDYRYQESGHGRQEIKYYSMLSNINESVDPDGKWESVYSVGKVDSVRTLNGKTTLETRYYISSLPNDAKHFSECVRSHWGIENSLHWILDVQFNEDNSRIRKDNSPENFAVLRHIAYSLLGQEKSLKFGIKSKRNRAGWDNDYLLKVLLS